MHYDSERNELAALLVRAAVAEERRQAAKACGDAQAAAALEDELRALWRRHGELERVA